MSDSGRQAEQNGHRPGGPVLTARRTTLAVDAPADLVAAALGGRHRMIVDAVPVAGTPRAIVASGAVLTFAATGGRSRCWYAGSPLLPPAGADPLARLWSVLTAVRLRGDPVVPAMRSMFGFVGYEAARSFERLPGRHGSHVPDYTFFFPATCVMLAASAAGNGAGNGAVAAGTGGDSGAGTAGGVTEVVGFGVDAAQAERACRHGVRAVRLAARQRVCDPGPSPITAVHHSLDAAGYRHAVERAKKYLLDGEIFQVVLAVQQHLSIQVDPLWLYRRLVVANPAPFQYCYTGPSFAAVGVSPEPFVTITGERVRLRPLAGTRPRGADPQADAARERELRSSEKELAEHRMLVDLARNDLGRVCRPGSVRVDELLSVERYAHVMHLVSNVVGTVDPGTSPHHILRAAFPAGTMTGAPKVRAMEIIDELEPQARGLYSGLVGLLAPEEVHTFLTIRSAYLRPGQATLAAGAGIVHDSDPAAEYAECLVKLRAVASVLGA